jgi:glycosyltransferase involved in cell wall biosynthesis
MVGAHLTSDRPLFSVATPTRNALDKLKRCIGSIRGQEGVTVEHLVQDACSSDGTPTWLSSQASLSARSERDDGMYDAINRAWARASGHFLSWLNADEQYLPGALAMVAKFFDAHPHVDVLFGDYIVCNDTGLPVALRREISFRRLYVVNSFLYAQSCTLFFRRALFDKGLLRFDTSLRYASDKDLMLKLVDAGARIAHLPQYLALFGIDGNNLSTHPQMQLEAEAVRQRHGAFGNRGLRELVLVGRRLERLLTGGYAKQSVVYAYAQDERPRYKEVTAHRVGGRYALSDGNQ